MIDADVSKRLAGWLNERGRASVAASALNLSQGVKDPDVLRALAAAYNNNQAWVLVTGDDAMPAEHGAVITETAATVATIHPEYPEDEMTEHAWRIDVVQRWAHAMQTQQPQSVRRYSLGGSEVWRPRRRHLRQIALHGWTPWRPAAPEAVPPPSPPIPSDPRFDPMQPQLPGFGS